MSFIILKCEIIFSVDLCSFPVKIPCGLDLGSFSPEQAFIRSCETPQE